MTVLEFLKWVLENDTRQFVLVLVLCIIGVTIVKSIEALKR
jgi:hypothetical protein